MAYWGNSDPLWLSLTGPQRAAAMALLEADANNLDDAKNALGAMVNRAEAERQPIGEHVSRKIYQPTIEPTQQQRLQKIVRSPEFNRMTALAEQRVAGEVPDWLGGATHFLAPEKTMLALEAREPNKYRSWREWTKYDPATGSYKGVVFRDGSHAFLKPEGSGLPGEPGPAPELPGGDTRNMVALAQTEPAEGAAAAAGRPAPPTPTLGPNIAASAPAAAPTPKKDDDAVLPMLANLLFSGGGGSGGLSIPGLGGGAEGGFKGMGGLLGDMFGGGGGANTGDESLKLAQGAMPGFGGAQPAPMGPRPSIDLSQLQAMIQSRPLLGNNMKGMFG